MRAAFQPVGIGGIFEVQAVMRSCPLRIRCIDSMPVPETVEARHRRAMTVPQALRNHFNPKSKCRLEGGGVSFQFLPKHVEILLRRAITGSVFRHNCARAAKK